MKGLTFICDECSQVLTITREGVLNDLPVRVCPLCGTRTLRPVESILDSTLKGRCFDKIDGQLVMLLFGVWREQCLATPTGLHPDYKRFVDYVKAQLA